MKAAKCEEDNRKKTAMEAIRCEEEATSFRREAEVEAAKSRREADREERRRDEDNRRNEENSKRDQWLERVKAQQKIVHRILSKWRKSKEILKLSREMLKKRSWRS